MSSNISRRSRAAFSLIEILVSVALLAFIILGLLSMFLQTQKAFRNSMKQVDVLEAGRAATDFLAREIVQMTPTQMPFTTNCLAELEASFNSPLYQELPGVTDRRTNIVERFFFVSRYNQSWVGTGYQVIPEAAGSGVGTLYRFVTNRTKFGAPFLVNDFYNAPLTNMSRVADGIVHFAIRAYSTNGFPLDPFNGLKNPLCFRTNADTFGTVLMGHSWGYWDAAVPTHPDYYFESNAVPAYVELELGVLEPPILERVRAIGAANTAAQRLYLSNHVANVHIFRQRIPIRNVDYSAYQ